MQIKGGGVNVSRLKECTLFKADMYSDIKQETAAKSILANLYLKPGICSEYIMVDLPVRAYSSCKDRGSRFTK